VRTNLFRPEACVVRSEPVSFFPKVPFAGRMKRRRANSGSTWKSPVPLARLKAPSSFVCPRRRGAVIEATPAPEEPDGPVGGTAQASARRCGPVLLQDRGTRGRRYCPPHVTLVFWGDNMFWHPIARTHRSRNRRAVLRLEELERRCCPSCTVTVTGHTLRIIGDAGDN